MKDFNYQMPILSCFVIDLKKKKEINAYHAYHLCSVPASLPQYVML